MNVWVSAFMSKMMSSKDSAKYMHLSSAKPALLGVTWQAAIHINQQCSSSCRWWWINSSHHMSPRFQSARPLSTPNSTEPQIFSSASQAFRRRLAGPDNSSVLQLMHLSISLFCHLILQNMHLLSTHLSVCCFACLHECLFCRLHICSYVSYQTNPQNAVKKPSNLR